MRELNIDLWDRAPDMRVITTNGAVKRNGHAVLGRGCAREAAAMYPWLPGRLGEALTAFGNHVHLIDSPGVAGAPGFGDPYLVTFPVKHRWDEQADRDLIVRSAKELVVLTDREGWRHVLMPRPGCGNGRLRWPDVRPLLDALLDERFFVTHVPAKQRT